MTVHLVGAGPGDPDLLTVRGAELLRAADVVVYDEWSVGDLLCLASGHAQLISVSTTSEGATVARDEITRLLLAHGRSGKTVVRLHGGDPFVFAPGGEEARLLIEAGIPVEIVPGVTSAIAAPAAAGIPVTMPDASGSFTVTSVGEDPAHDTSVDWETLARLGGTIVILEGVRRWPEIAAALVRGGLSPDTPAAAVRWGTRPEQVSVRATVATLSEQELRVPSTIVVGHLAAVDVGWFEHQPLFAKRVVVTRTRSQASELSGALRRRGAAPIEIPMIAITDPEDGGTELASAAQNLDGYDWVVLTSPNGAERFCGALRDARQVGRSKLAAIGPGTARVLASHNLVADLVPDSFVAEALLEAFPAPPDGGGRVLLARAAEARDVLPDGLSRAGWDVDVVPVYRTVRPEVASSAAEALRTADVVTFTSSSTVRHFVEMVGAQAAPPVVACIGPVTAATARELGMTVTVEATEHTIAGLVAALESHFTIAD